MPNLMAISQYVAGLTSLKLARVQDQGQRLGGQPGVVEVEPEKGVGIEEQFHAM